MVLHVRDEETDRLVRKLAQKRGVTITEAVRDAVTEALAAEDHVQSLWERTASVRGRLAATPKTGLVADKQFYDDLSGQGDD